MHTYPHTCMHTSCVCVSQVDPTAYGKSHDALKQQVSKLQEEASAAIRLKEEAAALRSKLQAELDSM